MLILIWRQQMLAASNTPNELADKTRPKEGTPLPWLYPLEATETMAKGLPN